MKANQKIYNMELHETLELYQITRRDMDKSTLVQRVPGGWIYSFANENAMQFVPMNKEFKKSWWRFWK